MPTQNCVRCEQRADFFETVTAENVTFDRQTPPLIVVEQDAFRAVRFPKNPVLGAKVFDRFLLLALEFGETLLLGFPEFFLALPLRFLLTLQLGDALLFGLACLLLTLALSFLLLIGMSLVADGLGFHIPKGYIYFAMGFSVFVEFLNLRIRQRGGKAEQH